MWPFKPKWTPEVGETVLVNTSSSIYWKNDWNGDSAKMLVIEVIAGSGSQRMYGFKWERYGRWQGGPLAWFSRNRLRKVTVAEPHEVRNVQPPLVDARVLAEVVALQKAVGGTEALLDLLRSVRAPYEIGKEDAS